MQKKDIGLASLSLFCLWVGIHPLDLWWLSWLAFIPLFHLANARNLSSRHLACLTYLAGFFYYGYGLAGLLKFDLFIYLIALIVTLPIFPVFFLLYRLLTMNSKSFLLKILTAPALWIAFQKIYSLSPFGNAPMDQFFYGPLEFFQIASLGGFQAHGALVIALSASIACVAKQNKEKKAIILPIFFIFCLAVSFAWGHVRLMRSPTSFKTTIKTALVQHNLQADAVWHVSNHHKILETYRNMAQQASAHGARLIIFPAYDIYDDSLRNPLFFPDLARSIKSHILLGSYLPTAKNGKISDGFREIAILYSPNGQIEETYQAIAPPPFRAKYAEQPSLQYKLLTTPFGKFGMLLCYENSVQHVAKKAALLGAQLLVSLSNPGFFNKTHLPYYHLMQDRLRAIESGKFLFRVSPNGYTAVVDPCGRFVQKTKLDEESILYTDLSISTGVTSFQKNADWLAILSGLFLLFVMIFQRKSLPKIRDN